jgi:hypothetical protein
VYASSFIATPSPLQHPQYNYSEPAVQNMANARARYGNYANTDVQQQSNRYYNYGPFDTNSYPNRGSVVER